MVSFQCHTCGDVVKKPKLDQHRARCHGGFDCIDCSTVFNTPADYKSHTTCISEAEKYQKALYKGPKTGQKNPPQNSKPVQEIIEKTAPTSAPAPVKKKETTHNTPGARNSNAQWGAPDPVQDFNSNGPGRGFNAHGRGQFNSYGQQLRTKTSGANDIPLGASKRPPPKVAPKVEPVHNATSFTSAPKVDFARQAKKDTVPAPAPSTSTSDSSSTPKDAKDKESKKDKKKKEKTIEAPSDDSEGNKKRKRGDTDAMDVDAADEEKRRAKEERRKKKKEAKAKDEPESAVVEDEAVDVGKKRKREMDDTPADKPVEEKKEKKDKKDKKKKSKDLEDAMDVDTPAVDAKKAKKSKDRKEKKDKSAVSL